MRNWVLKTLYSRGFTSIEVVFHCNGCIVFSGNFFRVAPQRRCVPWNEVIHLEWADVSDLFKYVLACAVSQETPRNQRTTCFDLLTLRQANMGYEKYSLHLIFTFYLYRDTSVLEFIPCCCISIKNIVRVDSSRRARDTTAMWSITWDIVVNRQQNLSNSSRHTQ